MRRTDCALFNSRAVFHAKRALSCLNLPKHAFYPVELLFRVYSVLIEVQFNRGQFKEASLAARRTLNSMSLVCAHRCFIMLTQPKCNLRRVVARIRRLAGPAITSTTSR